MANTNAGGRGDLGVGLISVGWMGKLHTRADQALPSVYLEPGLRPRLVHAADTAPDRAEYARDVLSRCQRFLVRRSAGQRRRLPQAPGERPRHGR